MRVGDFGIGADFKIGYWLGCCNIQSDPRADCGCNSDGACVIMAANKS